MVHKNGPVRVPAMVHKNGPSVLLMFIELKNGKGRRNWRVGEAKSSFFMTYTSVPFDMLLFLRLKKVDPKLWEARPFSPLHIAADSGFYTRYVSRSFLDNTCSLFQVPIFSGGCYTYIVLNTAEEARLHWLATPENVEE